MKTKKLLSLLLLGLLCSIGTAWGDTELFSTDFTAWSTQTVSAGNTVNNVYFKSQTAITNGSGFVFSSDATSGGNYVAVPISSVNGSITVTVTFGASKKHGVKYYLETGTSAPTIPKASFSVTSPTKLSENATSYSFTVSNITATHTYAVLYIGRNGADSKNFQSITITTPTSGGGGGGDPADTYDITYHCNGATDECPSDATEQTALPNPLPTPSKTDYSFGGWYTDEDLTVPAVAGAPLSADADLYAKWIKGVMHFWFAKESDRTSAGVVNSDIFSGTPTGSGSASYSATIEGKVYTITGRSSNATSSITFTIPSGKMAVLYAVTVGSSSRSLILKKGTPAVNVKSIVLPNSANEQTITNLDAGGYTLTSSGNIGWCMLALKIYNPEPYKLSLTENTWATFCPSFDVAIPDDARLTVYKATLAGELLTASPITGSIPAGTGVLLKANETADDYIFEKTEDAVTIDGNSLLGTTWPLTPDVESNTYYVLDAANSRFARFEGEIPANKAYVMISGAYSAAPAIRFEIEEENNATNIEKITTNGNTIKFIENGQFLIKRDGITYDALGRTIR